MNANGIAAETKSGNAIDDFEVMTSKAYIESCCKELRQKNTRNTSYGFKHLAENWGASINKLLSKKVFAEYVSNGAFIKAATHLGFVIFPIERSYNCHFKLSVKK